MIALARRRLHIPIMLVLRPGTMLPFALAPILALTIHILAAARAALRRTHARARRDFDVVRLPVVALLRRVVAVVCGWRRERHWHGRRRGCNEHGDGLRRGDRERARRGDRDVGCGWARGFVHDFGARVAALRGV
jgi:hypothetical protein